MPAHLLIEMAKQAIFWLHSFPRANGVSHHMSPREIMTGQKLDYARHCRFEFGKNVQTHEEHDSSMTPRTIGALAHQGGGKPVLIKMTLFGLYLIHYQPYLSILKSF
jgi:hypothetical protein